MPELAPDLDFRVVIPARYASTRYPGKVLADLAGKPLVQHVYERACASSAGEVVIATDDERVAVCCRDFGADVAMTRGDHPSGTDRVAEVTQQRGWTDEAIVVNVQGDAPLLPSAAIDQVARLLRDSPRSGVATLCTRITTWEDYRDANIGKVIFDHKGKALYFSRAPIPASLHAGEPARRLPEAWRHIGLYAYRVATLRYLTAAPPCALEHAEKLEQLRALWLGIEIRVAQAVEIPGPDVDTPEDIDIVSGHLDFSRGG